MLGSLLSLTVDAPPVFKWIFLSTCACTCTCVCIHTHLHKCSGESFSVYTKKAHVHRHEASPSFLSPSPVPSPILLSHPSISSPILNVRFHCEIIMLLIDWLVGCHFTLSLFGEQGSLLLVFKCLLQVSWSLCMSPWRLTFPV